MKPEYKDSNYEARQKLFDELKLTCEAKFVPKSASRNAKNKDHQVNFVFTLLRDGRKFYEGEYSKGMGHIPGYNSYRATRLAWEGCLLDFIEKGKAQRMDADVVNFVYAKDIAPDLHEVLYGMTMDADVLNYSSFEEWAPNLGIDPDSRSGFEIYQACLKEALSLRGAIGDDAMRQLQELYQDY